MRKYIVIFLVYTSSLYSQDFLKIAAGYLSGVIIHEGSHTLVAELTNSKYHWTYKKGPYYIIDKTNHPKLIASAGFNGEIIASEIALLGNMNDYKKGLIIRSIISPLTYVIADMVKPYGDIEYFRQSGGNTKALKAVLIAHAVVNTIRLYNKSKNVNPYIAYNEVGILINF